MYDSMQASMNRRSVVHNVRLLASIKHLTAEDLSDRTGIDVETISNWLTNDNPVAIPTIHIHDLATALDTTAEKLYQ